MRSKKFIILTITVFFTLFASYIYLVDQFVVVERAVPYSYRQFLLESTETISGKVIIESGSNSIHSIDPFLLSDYFNAPVITSAANAGYPIYPKIFNLLKVVKKGDILILPLEWNQYSYEDNLPNNFLNALADKNLKLEYYFNNLPLWEKIKFTLTQYPLDKVIDGLLQERNSEQLLRADLSRLSRFESILLANSNQTFGNSDRNGPEPVEKDGSHNRSCDEYVLGKQLTNGFIITKAFKDNLHSLKKLVQQGVDVYFTWPAVVDHQRSQCYQGLTIQNELKNFALKIKTIVEGEGFKFIGNYEQSKLPERCFLNTFYHIKKECATERTESLIRELTKRSVLPLKGDSSKSDLILVVHQRIKDTRKSLAKKLNNFLPTISVETVEARELSEKLLFVSGWSTQEKWGLWSLGEKSTFSFKLEDDLLNKDTVAVKIQGQYYNGIEETKVVINGLDLGGHVLMDKTFIVPTKLIKNNQVEVQFESTSTVSPAQLGRSTDTRNIKFGLKALSIS